MSINQFIMKFNLVFITVMFSLSGCTGLPNPDPKNMDPKSIIKNALTNPIRATIIESASVYGGSPENVQDTLKVGEEVLVEWLPGDEKSDKVHVYTNRGVFGTVMKNAVKLSESVHSANRKANFNLEWKETGLYRRDRQEFGPLFQVRKKIYGCKYVLAETPFRFHVIKDYTCEVLDNNHEGRGHLRDGITTVRIDDEFCKIVVDKSFPTKSEAMSHLDEKCH